MKKIFKIIIVVVCFVIGIILLDSIQALVFNNNPFIGFNTKCMSKEGILVNTYHCGNGKKITKFKLFNDKYSCQNICDLEMNDEELEQEIKDNIEKMLKVNNGLSSNPYDYIKNDYYKNIINLGNRIVPILEKMYKNSGSLQAYISAIAIQEITNCNIRTKYGLEWSTANEFYQLWEKYNCNYNSKMTIVDKSKEIDNFTCASILEPFYEDENYTYSYSCIKSNYVVVRYSDGSEETVKDALKNNHISISDLDSFNIDYYKQKK